MRGEIILGLHDKARENIGLMTIAEIRPYQDKMVILTLLDGEITTAKIAFVDAEYEDIVVDVIRTNRPDSYRDSNSAYAIAAADLVSIEEVPEQSSQ